MKRSTNLRLTIMAAAIPVALTACDPPPTTGQVVASVAECDKVTDVSPAECRAQFNKALEEHKKIAPRFESASDCSSQFGACTAVHNNGQTSYIPPMTGFLLGYVASDLLNSGSRSSSYRDSSAYRSSSSSRRDCDRNPDMQGCRSNNGGYRTVAHSTPLYRDYNTGEYRRPSGDPVRTNTGSGRTWDSDAAKPPPARAVSVSRSGFGSASAARSSFSSGRSSFGG
ncbi:DUF1190 domain-containing protein [Stenotrophomonas maltophilia]|uniref:DUF1190 domain-containing protein n=1 Tax=Stenotrophomonas maltophilia TaxID=40324 RepID=UPI0021CA46B1|nr:DUF1190 domain-containing protein [Stenotrophomonas maltophilia]